MLAAWPTTIVLTSGLRKRMVSEIARPAVSTAGDGGAAWSRNGRTVTVHADYLERFVAQGQLAGQGAALPVVR